MNGLLLCAAVAAALVGPPDPVGRDIARREWVRRPGAGGGGAVPPANRIPPQNVPAVPANKE